jgi:hypothetical protein
MKLPEWSFIYFRKLPYNFDGQVILDFRDGELTEATRIDKLNKDSFLIRYKEARFELAGGLDGDQPYDVSAAFAK